MIYHRHHIIPKHMGGSDDADNIVKLTIEEHAIAHKELYEKYGKEEDKLAWLGLSGIVTVSDRIKLQALAGGYFVRDNKIGIHDPNKIYLKSKGGKIASKKLVLFSKNSKWINNGIVDTRVNYLEVENYISKGWKLGRIFSPNKGKTSKTKNSVWVNKEKINKRIHIDEKENYLNLKWNLGMYMKEIK